MKNLLLFGLIILSQSLSAQNHIDLVNIYWRATPITTPVTITEPDGPNGMFNTYVANLKIPIKLNEDNVLIGGLEYQHNTITTVTNSIIDEYLFASSTIQLGLQHTWNTRSKMLFMALGRLNTDYINDSTSAPASQFGGLVLGTTKRNENFDWKYGLYYNGEFFGPMFVPLFGFNWKVNEKLRFKLILPINFELAYYPKKWFRTGLRFDGVNASYRAAMVPHSTIPPNEYLDKADNNLWGFTEFLLGKNCWIHFKAGHSVLRKYTYYKNDSQLNLKIGPVNIGDNREEKIQALSGDGLSFEMRFIYRLPID